MPFICYAHIILIKTILPPITGNVGQNRLVKIIYLLSIVDTSVLLLILFALILILEVRILWNLYIILKMYLLSQTS